MMVYSNCALSFFSFAGTATNTFNEVTSLDNIPNGWGNDYTTYLTGNSIISNGALQLTLSNSGCPGSINPPFSLFTFSCFLYSFSTFSRYSIYLFLIVGCGNTPFSSGAWESIPRYTYGTFTFTAAPSNVPGMSTYPSFSYLFFLL